MSSNGNSANTAILAIFVVVVMAMLGYFVFIGGDDSDVELKVDVPEIEQLADGK